MNKLFYIVIFFAVSLLARHDAYPTKVCPAFNNMKHSKNTSDVYLNTKQKYTVLKYHKGQVLVLIKGEQPAQRWVDGACFLKRTNGSNPMNVKKVEIETLSMEDALLKSSKSTDIANFTKKHNNPKLSQHNLLSLSWHNAFCETHRYKKECKKSIFSFAKDKYKEKHFVLHGLWPQPRNNIYCGVGKKYVSIDKHKQWNRLPDLGLSDDAKRRLIRVMPGFNSNLHRHEWIKHGTCYGTDAKQYYEDAVNLVEQLNDSKVGVFFSKNIGKHVTLQQIRALFNRSFGAGSGKRVELKCKGGLITELWLHLGSGSDDLGILLAKGKKIRSRCQGGMLDKAGF